MQLLAWNMISIFQLIAGQVVEFNAWYNCTQDPDCDENVQFPNYTIPQNILNWPGNGDVSKSQDFFLAPFYDRNGDGVYDPTQGDYPHFDLENEIDCKTSQRSDRITLYGDYNLWWVFNDKGNIHTETGADPIGMEIRAQAFAFSTSDEINSMTFYNYEMFNQGSQTLFNTYFAQWVDPDLGCYNDDYVGCDVGRGLGYCYNGNAVDNDCGQAFGYGPNPPACRCRLL
jgi:hypothetical protein